MIRWLDPAGGSSAHKGPRVTTQRKRALLTGSGTGSSLSSVRFAEELESDKVFRPACSCSSRLGKLGDIAVILDFSSANKNFDENVDQCDFLLVVDLRGSQEEGYTHLSLGVRALCLQGQT